MPEDERRLAAVMFTDVVGFSASASQDEARALGLLGEQGKLLRTVFLEFAGEVVKSTGDGFLVEFASAVQAVNCAVEAQRKVAASNANKSPAERAQIRIGIHVGEVVHVGTDILGDTVNVAARLQTLAEPGGICVSRQVVDQVQRKTPHTITSMGVRELKNIRYPVEVFRLSASSDGAAAGEAVLDPRRVAVLPFANLSPDPNDRYFADGITEEIISTVSNISELQVISRTSVMRYRETQAQISQIGQELGVGSVLEGSVRKAGNKVRITAQLIRVEGDKHVWAHSYDRDLTDVFGIQADIAEQVAGSLKIQLLTTEKQNIRREATSNPEAYTMYLKGRFFWNERTEEGVRKALTYFEKASSLDPGFAMAYSGIADSYNVLEDYGWTAPSEAHPLARMNASKAVEIDSSLAEAHASLGLAIVNASWDLNAAEREYKRAIELKPNYAPAHHWYNIALFVMRRYGESAEEEAKALALDPYSRVYNMVSANLMLFEKRYDEAIERYDQMIELSPDMSPLRLWRSTAYLLAGRFDDAIVEANQYLEMEGGIWKNTLSSLFMAWVYAVSGRRTEAKELVERAVLERQHREASATNIGMVKLELGETDEGYRWLQKGFDERDPRFLYFNGFPWLSKFRSDPRWKSIEARLPFRCAEG